MNAFYADNDTAIIGCYCVTDRHETFFLLTLSLFFFLSLIAPHYESYDDDELYLYHPDVIMRIIMKCWKSQIWILFYERGKNVDSVIELLKIHQLKALGQWAVFFFSFFCTFSFTFIPSLRFASVIWVWNYSIDFGYF